MMRAAVVLLGALGLGGCTSVDVDTDESSGTYTLVLPTDGIRFPSPTLGEVADDICPHGWVLWSAMDLPSDAMWQVGCHAAPATVPPPAAS